VEEEREDGWERVRRQGRAVEEKARGEGVG
jgi:hypothetical protein